MGLSRLGIPFIRGLILSLSSERNRIRANRSSPWRPRHAGALSRLIAVFRGGEGTVGAGKRTDTCEGGVNFHFPVRLPSSNCGPKPGERPQAFLSKSFGTLQALHRLMAAIQASTWLRKAVSGTTPCSSTR